MSELDELMTTAEVAAYLRRPEGTLRQWRYRGYGPRGFKMGGLILYRRSAVERFLAECEAAEDERYGMSGEAT